MMRWCLSRSFQFSVLSFALAVIIGLSCMPVPFYGGACFAIENKTFDATIDFLNKGVSFRVNLQEQGQAKVSAKIEGATYDINVILRHIKFGQSDLSTDFYARGVIIRTKEGKLSTAKGKAWTQASLLNFKPLKEFSAEYELTNTKLTVYSLSWANFALNGQITRDARNALSINPFSNAEVDLFLAINDMDLKDFAGLLGVGPEAVALEGKVSGQIRIQGPHDAVKIEAKLTASEGSMSTLKFKSAKIEAEGFWPILRFINAQVNEAQGVVYELKGKFNVRELSDFNSAQHEVTVYSANNAMRLQDWVIRREHTYKGEEVVEAEYNLEKNQALKMRIKDQEEILGWEKTVKF